MPTFFRFARDTTRMERISSYSTGRPRSKNGITNSSEPHVKTRPRKISLIDSALSSVGGTRGADVVALLGLARLRRILHRLDDAGQTAVSAVALELAQHAHQVVARIDVAARNLRTEVRLDEDRLLRVQALEQRDRFGESEWICSRSLQAHPRLRRQQRQPRSPPRTRPAAHDIVHPEARSALDPSASAGAPGGRCSDTARRRERGEVDQRRAASPRRSPDR